MKAFEVYLNGKYLATAGTDHVLSTIVSWSNVSPPAKPGGEFHFHVGGIDPLTSEHVDWSVPEVGVGDEITIKIIETDQLSPEHRRYVFQPPLPGETMDDYKKRLATEGQNDIEDEQVTNMWCIRQVR